MTLYSNHIKTSIHRLPVRNYHVSELLEERQRHAALGFVRGGEYEQCLHALGYQVRVLYVALVTRGNEDCEGGDDVMERRIVDSLQVVPGRVDDEVCEVRDVVLRKRRKAHREIYQRIVVMHNNNVQRLYIIDKRQHDDIV